MRSPIPNSVLAVVSQVLGAHYYSHSRLNRLFTESGAPGGPPDGNCVDKSFTWLKRANEDPEVDPLTVLGNVLSQFMETGDGIAQMRVREVLAKNDLAYDNGRIVSYQSSGVRQRVGATDERPTDEDVSEDTGGQGAAIRLFISHSSDDAALAERLANLFRLALGLPARAIRCTSVDGYRLPGGVDTDERLRAEVRDADAFIGLISSMSVQSHYVLFELGARWGAKKHLIPVIAPGASMSLLGGPLSGLNALRADSRPQVLQLLQDVATQLNMTTEPPASYDAALQSLLELPIAVPQSNSTRASEAVAAVPLSEDSVRALTLLSRIKAAPVEWLAEQMRISVPKAHYFIDRLAERDLASHTGVVPGGMLNYFVTDRGRQYLFDRGLLE